MEKIRFTCLVRVDVNIRELPSVWFRFFNRVFQDMIYIENIHLQQHKFAIYCLPGRKNAFVCRMSREDVIMVWVTLKLEIRNNEVRNPSGMSDNKFLEFAEFCRKRYDWCQTRCVD